MMRTEGKQRGFTLVELLVVVAILGLLISILLPTFNRARLQARNAASQARLAGLSSACERFQMDNQRWPGQSFLAAGKIQDGTYTGTQAMAIDIFGLDPSNNWRVNPDATTYDSVGEKVVEYTDAGGATREGTVVDDFNDTKINRSANTNLGMPYLYYLARRNAGGTNVYVQADNDEYLLSVGSNSKYGTYNTSNSLDDAVEDTRLNSAGYQAYRPDSFVLIGAGIDREYFTDDDNTNYK